MTQGQNDSPRKWAKTTHLPRQKQPTLKIGLNHPGQTTQGRNDADSLKSVIITVLLAHLSGRLVGELIVYPWSGRRRPSVVHNFKHEYLCNHWVDHNEILSILSEASLGWVKGCFRFLARSDWNSGYHGNRKLP